MGRACMSSTSRRPGSARSTSRGAVVFEVGRTQHPNHAGIYLGTDAALPGRTKVFGAGPFLLHHLYGKPSEIIVYGGNLG